MKSFGNRRWADRQVGLIVTGGTRESGLGSTCPLMPGKLPALSLILHLEVWRKRPGTAAIPSQEGIALATFHAKLPSTLTRLLPALCTALILLLASGIAHAHGGYESETEVRLYPDRMRIVARTSLPFAWRILGAHAPPTSDAAGQAAARPQLATAAASLFEVTADGKPLAPVKTNCIFEVHGLHDHAAFVLDYSRPTASPVVVKATFFPLLGELDNGSISVFDHSSSFERDIEPFLKRTLSFHSPSVTFDIGLRKDAEPATTTVPASPSVPAPAPPPLSPARPWLIPLCLAIALLAAILIRAALKRSTP